MMMLKKVIFLTIVLLLNYSKSSSQIKIDSSSTGEGQQANVIVPINVIKDVNAKLIERLHLIDINKHQDSVINLNKLYIDEQLFIIKDFQNKVNEVNKINTSINNQLIKSKKSNKVYKSISIGAITVAILSFLIK